MIHSWVQIVKKYDFIQFYGFSRHREILLLLNKMCVTERIEKELCDDPWCPTEKYIHL